MPRNMSFMLTTRQIRDKSKDVTRRLGWKNMKVGQRFWAVEKAMGLKPGEKIQRIHLCECVSITSEKLIELHRNPWRGELDTMQDECTREGFPEKNTLEFVSMFCEHMNCFPETIVQRIEFKYVTPTQGEKK